MMHICFIEYSLKYCKRLYISTSIAEGHIFPQILQNLIYLSRSSWYKVRAPFPIESISCKRDCDCNAIKANCTDNDIDDGENVPLMKSRAPDMKFVQNFTPPDFQAKNFTPSISPNFNSFSDKNTKKWVKMEKFTPLTKILHCRRQWRQWQIPPLWLASV